jgi:hypothetical protein
MEATPQETAKYEYIHPFPNKIPENQEKQKLKQIKYIFISRKYIQYLLIIGTFYQR